MPIWVMMGHYEGEMYCSSHLTEKGAALAAIADVLLYLGIEDEDDALNVMNSRHACSETDGEQTEAIEWDREKLSKMSMNELWGVFGEWGELTWDDHGGYRIEVSKTTLTG